jgi:hypothetical protein
MLSFCTAQKRVVIQDRGLFIRILHFHGRQLRNHNCGRGIHQPRTQRNGGATSVHGVCAALRGARTIKLSL